MRRSRDLLESAKESKGRGRWKVKVKKKRLRVEGIVAYVPFQRPEILVIDASDITPAFVSGHPTEWPEPPAEPPT